MVYDLVSLKTEFGRIVNHVLKNGATRIVHGSKSVKNIPVTATPFLKHIDTFSRQRQPVSTGEEKKHYLAAKNPKVRNTVLEGKSGEMFRARSTSHLHPRASTSGGRQERIAGFPTHDR